MVSMTIEKALKAPQAQDDTGSVLEDDTVDLDVLDNDKGGKSKSIYSLNQADPTSQTSEGDWVILGSGARIKIVGDEIVYDTNNAFESLAEGEDAFEVFTYTIQLGNGTISVAEVTVTITGQNDAPTVSDVTGAAMEDGASVEITLAGADIDSDNDSTDLTYTIVSPPGAGEGSASIMDDKLTFVPGADFQNLAAGETQDVTITYMATDDHGAMSGNATVTVTVTGVNDVAQITGDTGSVTEDGTLIADGTVVVNDADDGQSGTAAQTGVAGSYGMFSIDTAGVWSYTLDNDNPAVQALNTGETLMDTFPVSSTDSSASADVVITINGVDDGSLPIIEGIDDQNNNLFGDSPIETSGASFMGGDQQLIGGDVVSAGFFVTNTLVGDVGVLLNNGTFVGGDDELLGGDLLAPFGFMFNILVGDASSVTGTGDSTGGADTIYGGDGAFLNTIIGDFDAISTTNASATLTGGDDTIFSGADANDTIWGDWEDASGFVGTVTGGADTFVFGVNNGMDTINDFRSADGDKIDLSALAISFATLDTSGNGVLDDLDVDVSVLGGSTIINLGNASGGDATGDQVTVLGVTGLVEADFIF